MTQLTGATITTTPTDLRSRAEAHLRELAGEHARLRTDQWTAIEALVTRRKRALVVQRTGWGKSAVYFVATALLRADGAGPTVIVSPLLALMRNQIEAAEKAGIRAVTINSSNVEDWDRVRADVAAGAVDVLLVSPERLNNPDFRRNVLPGLAAGAGLIVIDEAHCVSDWGHDFRPDYRRIRDLLAGLPPDTPVLATTATANSRVTHDVAEQLGGTGSVLILRGTLDRSSLRLSVTRPPDSTERLAWLAERLRALPGSGIIYTLTVAAAEQTAEFLRDQGHEVLAYTGKTEVAERLAAEQALLGNDVKALVATSALGMGFDKPDLGFVVHVGAPQSPVAYYQQVGRAGRGVDRAEVILLPGTEDKDIWRYFASLAFPPSHVVEEALTLLAVQPCSVPALEAALDLSRSRIEMMLKVLDVEGAVERVDGSKWRTTGRPWVYDGERYRRVAAARVTEQNAMLTYLDLPSGPDGCRMAYLRRQLDDPLAEPCGRCDNCTETRAATSVSPETAAAARARLYRPGIDLAPRKMWPTGLKEIGLSGRIKPEHLASPGRALADLYVGWGNRLRGLLRDDSPDRDLPGDILPGLRELLASWPEATDGTTAVVTLPSARRPRLLGSLGDALARELGVPHAGALAYRAGPPARRSNGAQRARAVWGTLAVPGDLRAALSADASADAPGGWPGDGPGGAPGGTPGGGPNGAPADAPSGGPGGGLRGAPGNALGGKVLLVDDLADSKWTLTVAARLLREAGCGEVVPLVLATVG